MPVPVDLAREANWQGLISNVSERFGTIDILIINAGIETEGAYLDLEWTAIRENIEVNMIAPMALTYHVLPHMIAKKQGHIVHIASMAGARYLE